METVPCNDPYGQTSTCRVLIGSVLDLISNKWAVPIIMALGKARAPVRFSSLSRGIAMITQKELTKQLRALEAAGLVGRKIYPEVPPRVEYWLTDLGRSLRPVLDALARWAATHGTKVAAHRARADTRKAA